MSTPELRVHLARLGDALLDAPVDAFERLAGLDPDGAGAQLTDDPAQAGLILFTQLHMLAGDVGLAPIREHPLTRRHPERIAVYDERDRPRGTLPGLYVSMPVQHWQAQRFRACAYYSIPRPAPRPGVEPDLLFSFMGSPTHPCREPLYALADPRGLTVRVKDFTFWEGDSAGFAQQQARYRDALSRSRFVLCPRGHGTGSIRLFEVLASGRVPVIISDDWVAPEGPDWSACSLRWPEQRTDGLVDMLLANDDRWADMSAAAAAAYDRFFAPEAATAHLFAVAGELLGTRPSLTASWRDGAYQRASVDAAYRNLRVRLGRARRRSRRI